ncbi:chromosome transmission fidelity protein 8 [Clohesyomyces aquaticus]|uniref:Chromosome transmission fidelity protein 8 n=1 Tax=Clohesyomyces aquaticus TaxID=1231657 RepID=A0A1Y1ZQ45_9PLEO|nr:chromosome transmission fidelity protein 8 [Clohesyomyces aquaticus]
MPSIPLHISQPSQPAPENPLPPLLHTPTGLAILELQGTIHFPTPTASAHDTSTTQVGKLVFPLYNPNALDPSDTKWMKRVYMYVGKHQRLTGEIKKLGKPFAVIRKREKGGERGHGDVDMDDREGVVEELEIVQIVKYKIVFSTRPEPVGGEEV